MGRKIPGKKHKGVKDPAKQRASRYNSIKDKINAPPLNPDDQYIPKRLMHIMDLKEKVKTGVIGVKRTKKRRKVPVTKLPGGIKYDFNSQNEPSKPAPTFVQNKGESDYHFLRRVNKLCETVINENAFENKYGVKINRNSQTGEVEVVKRPKDELDLLMKKSRKEKTQKGKKNKKKSKDLPEPRLTKSQKRQRKLAAKKEKKLENKQADFADYKDNVTFGETVHGPPSLNAPKHGEILNCGSRPGQKDLLLKLMMQKQKVSPKTLDNKDTMKKTANKVINKAGKRKDLPNALRRQLDQQQSEIINAYKMLKKQKYNKT